MSPEIRTVPDHQQPGELAAITLALPAGLTSPLAPTRILRMNIVTDSPPALALAMDPADPDTMKRPPRRPKQQILTWQTSTDLILTGLVIALVTPGVFAGYLAGGPVLAAKAGTMAFPVIVISQLFTALAYSGSRERSLLEPVVFRNPWLQAAVGFGGWLRSSLSRCGGRSWGCSGRFRLVLLTGGLSCWLLLLRLLWWRG